LEAEAIANSAVIARHLAGIGLNLFSKTTVADNLSRLTATLRQVLGRSDVIITTGGASAPRPTTSPGRRWRLPGTGSWCARRS
jgi:molybdopterin biosynthesis enzyme MoaB